MLNDDGQGSVHDRQNVHHIQPATDTAAEAEMTVAMTTTHHDPLHKLDLDDDDDDNDDNDEKKLVIDSSANYSSDLEEEAIQ